jgi:aldehyde dehydrogenase (NAD+)
MARVQAVPLAPHAFADGSFKRMPIDGTWVDAASGKHFESRKSDIFNTSSCLGATK